jgi:N-acetylmuramoyl-L-alanine amidase
MITKSNLVRRGGYISRIMALPLLFVMVSAFAVKFTNTSKGKPALPFYDPITVVIDAGHGGSKFTGAAGPNGLLEKDIDLAIAKKIYDLAGTYNVKVIMTRTEDKVVGNAANLKEDLENRAKITNESKADAFVSIHINATSEKRTALSGFGADLPTKRNDPQSTALATIMLEGFKNIYTADQFVTKRQIGIYVLDKAIIPATLITCGYITNPKDAAFISQPENQEKIAKNILESLVKYALQNRQASQPNHISAEYLSKMDPHEVQSVKADLSQTNGIVYLKNGSTKSFNINEVNEYYKKHNIEGQLKGYLTNVNMVDSVVEITYHPLQAKKGK